MRRGRDRKIGVLRRLGAALALLCFVMLQSAAIGHAAGLDLLSPDHDRTACAFCAGNDRAGAPPQPAEPAPPAIVLAADETPAPKSAPRVYDAASLPPARGPPSL